MPPKSTKRASSPRSSKKSASSPRSSRSRSPRASGVKRASNDLERCIAMNEMGLRCPNRKTKGDFCAMNNAQYEAGTLIGQWNPAMPDAPPMVYDSSRLKAASRGAAIVRSNASWYGIPLEKLQGVASKNAERVMCRCILRDGTPCPYPAADGQIFCAIHSNGKCSVSLHSNFRTQHPFFIPGVDTPYQYVGVWGNKSGGNQLLFPSFYNYAGEAARLIYPFDREGYPNVFVSAGTSVSA